MSALLPVPPGSVNPRPATVRHLCSAPEAGSTAVLGIESGLTPIPGVRPCLTSVLGSSYEAGIALELSTKI